MSKDEVVLLVSRAVAAIQCITAMVEISYLPERFMSLHHYRSSSRWIAPDYLTSIYSLEFSMLCFRIAGLLVLTWVFWQCGPWLKRLLMPDQRNEAQVEDRPLKG